VENKKFGGENKSSYLKYTNGKFVFKVFFLKDKIVSG
jgi:hypothetical protein